MKKLFICLSVIGVLLVSCSNDYDDSALWDSVNGLENRVAKLEELCKQMNTNISSLQEIVKALKERESITNVSTLSDGSGYSITFTSGKTITIYHGKNGSDGSDGTNGVTPTISVKQDTDGIYYWTVNGNWLIVDGKKVKAIGTDGADGSDGNDGTDGTNGKDGITPKFKIDGGYWYISYDNEQNWERLGKATGDSGLNGEDGDAFFKGVSIADGFVIFTLNDAESTEIKIPFYSGTELTVHVTEPGTLKSLLTDEQMRTSIKIVVSGEINNLDLRTIATNMTAIEDIDLSNAIYINNLNKIEWTFCGGELLKPQSAYGNKTIKKIILPQIPAQSSPSYLWLNYPFEGCTNLKQVIICVDCYASGTNLLCPNLECLIYRDGVKTIKSSGLFHSSFPIVDIPQTVTQVHESTFYAEPERIVILRNPTPPIIGSSESPANKFDYNVSKITLLVPKEAVSLYKSTNGWKDFKTILPIPE